MDAEDLKIKVQSIVEKATTLKNKHIEEKNISVNYACIFAQTEEELKSYLKSHEKLEKLSKKRQRVQFFILNHYKPFLGF